MEVTDSELANMVRMHNRPLGDAVARALAEKDTEIEDLRRRLGQVAGIISAGDGDGDEVARFAAAWSGRAGGRLVTVFRAAEPVTGGQYVTPVSDTEVRPTRIPDGAVGTALCDALPGEFVAVASGLPR